MPETFEALAVVGLALLPGALYTWAFEGIVGRWGAGFSDRVLRFVGTSAALHALVAPLTYWLWARYVERGTLAAGEPLPWSLWMVVAGYVAVPYVGGYIVGVATKNRRRWAEVVTGRNPAPRAWDNFFTDDPEGWIRLKLKSGTWVLGPTSASRLGTSGAIGGVRPLALVAVLAFSHFMVNKANGLTGRSMIEIWSSDGPRVSAAGSHGTIIISRVANEHTASDQIRVSRRSGCGHRHCPVVSHRVLPRRSQELWLNGKAVPYSGSQKRS